MQIESSLSSRSPIWIIIGLGWFAFLVLAAGLTLFLHAWQGFSPEGPPAGFAPEPLRIFFLKQYPFVLFSVLHRLWGISLALLALTILEVWRGRTEKPVGN